MANSRRILSLALTLMLMLLCTSASAGKELSPAALLADDVYERKVYGYSEMGQDMACHRVGRPDAEIRILMTFGVHGFEDHHDHDGLVLTSIAESLIGYYLAHTDELEGFALYIVPYANPDGLRYGETEDGFGRCNLYGLDINRDFPTKWKHVSKGRYKNGPEPFSTAEARSIRNLVEDVQPTIGIDVHGWINGVYGDQELAQPFCKALDCEYRRDISSGMLHQWYNEVLDSGIMIELAGSPSRAGYVQDMTRKLIKGLEGWITLRREKTANELTPIP